VRPATFLVRRRTFLVRRRAEALVHLTNTNTNSQYNLPPFAKKLAYLTYAQTAPNWTSLDASPTPASAGTWRSISP
jgi:hypothetical protein